MLSGGKLRAVASLLLIQVNTNIQNVIHIVAYRPVGGQLPQDKYTTAFARQQPAHKSRRTIVSARSAEQQVNLQQRNECPS
jgi:hypothetical protein